MHYTFRQKIGQLFILGFSGNSIAPENPIALDIKKHSLGGVILFDRLLAQKKTDNNIIDPTQLRRLTHSLQDLAAIPLLICVDQEGGRVCRFSRERGFTTTPAAEELGSRNNLQATNEYGRQTAEMLHKAGVNVNLAPVVDLNIYHENPIIGKYGRSFSEYSSTVTAHAEAWITQHRQANVLTCLKHFPGHGSSRDDSHHGFVDITNTWQEFELQPFRELVEKHMADLIMMGHLFNRNFDKNYPATLSKQTVDNLLYRKLRFAGPVVSDDMQMKAITDHFGLSEACCMAIAAGVDLIIVGNNLEYNPHVLIELIDEVEKAVENGTIEENRIEAAFQKTQNIKKELFTGRIQNC